jgi:hypothetical protein
MCPPPQGVAQIKINTELMKAEMAKRTGLFSGVWWRETPCCIQVIQYNQVSENEARLGLM